MKKFKFTTKATKKCKECNQEISSIEHLIGDEKILSYNKKTGTWVEKAVVDGDKKT